MTATHQIWGNKHLWDWGLQISFNDSQNNKKKDPKITASQHANWLATKGRINNFHGSSSYLSSGLERWENPYMSLERNLLLNDGGVVFVRSFLVL